MRVNLRDIAGAVFGTAIMLLALAPLRAMAPGIFALLLQAGAGIAIYAGVAFALDLCQLRSWLVSRLRAISASSKPIPRSAHSKTASP
jgi:hypothetical protein